MAETQYSIRTVKTFPYRDDPLKRFSNRYHFDGGDPGTSGEWHDLMDAVVALEKTIWGAAVHIVDVFGYAPGSLVAVASKSYTTAGTLSMTTALSTPGDCAICLRMATTKRSVKNHPVYVFSFFHYALTSSAVGGADDIYPAQKTAVDAYGTNWLDGIATSSRTYKRTTPDGHPTTGRFTDPYITHRDFPR